MGILSATKEFEDWKLENSKISPENYWKSKDAVETEYKMTSEELKVARLILRNFQQGDATMQKPRVEFNDLSVVQRQQYDEMSWNTYQPNNGDPAEQDIVGGWKSNALKPVVRNKCISIAAHATARLIFPKVFAYDKDSEVHEEAAHVMEDLMEWSGDKSNYPYTALNRVISALYEPASIGYTEYVEVYRPAKEIKENGVWKEKMMYDEDLSGFQDTPVPVDQLYIENFYEPNIQKQGWLIWRRVRSYSLLESIYKAKYPNFKYVKPGVQLIYNDANATFYQVYDTLMRPEMCEEVIWWNRALDLKIIMVNGVMLTDSDNPNPRNDKLYPFDKFGYELINTRCFYYKSLAFKLQQDANIINTLYPMVIDGTYLNLMPPMIAAGQEMNGAEVVVPGLVTTLNSPEASITPVTTGNNLKAGLETLFKVEESLNDSSQEPLMQGKESGGGTTAYEISRIEQNANTVLGLFIKMISEHVRQFGRLRKGDVLQYMTIADVNKIEDNTELIYRTFLLPNKRTPGGVKTRKIKFDANIPDAFSSNEKLAASYEILKEQDKSGGKIELIKANPEKFRNLTFEISISPDILNPRSEDLERAYKLELYDRAINNPLAEQENVFKDFLLGAYRDIGDPEKYVAKPQAQIPPPQASQNSPTPSPLEVMRKKAPLPQVFNT